MKHDNLIEELLHHTPHENQKELVLDLMKLLSLKKTAVYNRLTGRTTFSIEEVIMICTTYHISLDNIIFKDKVDDVPHPFYSDALRSMPRTYVDYLKNIQLHTRSIRSIKSKKEFTFIVKNFTIFHLIGYDHLCYLQLFLWNLSSWNMNEVFEAYNPQELIGTLQYQKIKKDILSAYLEEKSVEVWNKYMFKYLTDSILFIRNANLLNDSLYKTLLVDINRLYENTVKTLESGKKMSINSNDTFAERTVYLNETIQSGEKIMVKYGCEGIIFTMYDVPNYIRTNSPLMISHLSKWIDNIIDQSTNITSSSKLERKSILSQFKEDIDNLK